MPSDLFVILVITAMAAFMVTLGLVSVTDRDHQHTAD